MGPESSIKTSEAAYGRRQNPGQLKMRSWRLQWAFEELTSGANFRRHRTVLKSPWKFWFALAAKLIPRVWKHPVTLRLKKGGVFDVAEFMTLYVYKEIFVDGCYDYPALAEEEPLIVDIGANTGLFAVRMKQLYPKSRVECYEPFGPNYEQLSKTLTRSGFDGCRAYKEGVGATARVEKLYVHPRNLAGHSIYSDMATSAEHVEIRLVDLRSVIDRLNGATCSLLKLDCEGAEYEIIKSLDKNSAPLFKNIVFESTPSTYDVNELTRHLQAIGYRTGTHNGLHVARYETTESAAPDRSL
jgi:FkbM family methyltransferase